MLLKDSVTVFVKRTSDEDRYRPEFRRYELHDVMVFEKQSVGSDNRDTGSCVIYVFPGRSRVAGGGALPELHPGDFCLAGRCRQSFDPLADGGSRIVSVTEQTSGSERTRHIKIEAV